MEEREVSSESAPRILDPGGTPMLSEEQWGAVRSLAGRGMGTKAIARQLGLTPKTVRKYRRQGGRPPYQRRCPAREALERDHGAYLEQRAAAVNWCAQVLLQELQALGYVGSYDAVKRWVAPRREAQRCMEDATVRFETGPGRQAQVDWGSTAVMIGDELVRVHLFVMTLGFSRRMFARAYPNERLAALVDGHERAFAHFGGRTDEILYDNPRTIVERRDRAGKHIEWNPRFRDFADYVGYQPRLCRPYRARTKGKVESGVKYLKRNFLAGRAFVDLADTREQWGQWNATVADVRVHGTTHQAPLARFADEQGQLMPRAARPGFKLEARFPRIVAEDFLVSLDTNRYSVPFTLIGHAVEVERRDGQVRIHHRGKLVVAHAELPGRYGLVVLPEHGPGPAVRNARLRRATSPAPPQAIEREALTVEQRDLATYDSLVAAGGER